MTDPQQPTRRHTSRRRPASSRPPSRRAGREEWLASRIFHAEPDAAKKPYSIVIPPPNVTGNLHMGHALNGTIQDVLTRYHRMLGENACWLPGTDHAGIATQNVIEKQLRAQGQTKEDLGREEFAKRVWAWRREYGGNIINQLKRLGCACDYERERFTFDDGYVRAVLKVFVALYKKGYIHKDVYLVNWCPRCGTAISDLEVAHVEDPGHLYHVRYDARGRRQRDDRDDAPRDDARRHGGGREPRRRPLRRHRRPHGHPAAARPPASGHRRRPCREGLRQRRPQDHAGARHHRLRDRPRPQAGHRAGDRDRGRDHRGRRPLRRASRSREARERVVADLEKLGALEKVEDFPHSVASCDRCGTFIEPLISEQWFMDMDELRRPATEVVRDGRVKFTPERWGRVYIDWMDNLRPWCISRQLWWGHQLPVWYCEADGCGEVIVEEEAPLACPACGGTALRRDTDVLDTWFSSALWPFATWGWPDETPDLAYFYPTNVLSTAREIIFLWVARMVMMGLEFVGEIPFTDVYIHSVIQAADGRRMSKSLGTGIDPLDMIDKYGADATRFGLLMMSSTQDVRFSEEKIAMGRSFANKLWNASRLVLLASEGCAAARGDAHQVDRWIASRFGRCVEAVEAAVAVYDFAAAADTLYHFVWDEFCDWYLELAKVRLYSDDEAERREAAGHARWMLDQIVRLLHPFLPYVTDEVAAQYGAAPLLAQAHPRREDFATAEADEAALADLQALVNALRAFRAEGGVAPGQVLDAVFVGDEGRRRGAVRAVRGGDPRPGAHRGALRRRARVPGRHRRARPRRPPRSRVGGRTGARRSPVSRVSWPRSRPRWRAARPSSPTRPSSAGRRSAIVAKEREKLAGYLADRDELAARAGGAALGLNRPAHPYGSPRVHVPGDDWQDYLDGLAVFGMRPGLERVSALLDALGRPQDGFRVGPRRRHQRQVLDDAVRSRGPARPRPALRGLPLAAHHRVLRACARRRRAGRGGRVRACRAARAGRDRAAAANDLGETTQFEVLTVAALLALAE